MVYVEYVRFFGNVVQQDSLCLVQFNIYLRQKVSIDVILSVKITLE